MSESVLMFSSKSFIVSGPIFRSLTHFLIESLILVELSCRSCLYIFEINSLSVASFAIIFSHSEGCLFTLLIVSFVVFNFHQVPFNFHFNFHQKLLIFIRSHLFIFAFISNILRGGLQRILLWFIQESVLPMFSSRSLSFWSYVYIFNPFEFIFVYGVRKCSSFILLQVVDQFSHHNFSRDCVFSIEYSCILCQR